MSAFVPLLSIAEIKTEAICKVYCSTPVFVRGLSFDWWVWPDGANWRGKHSAVLFVGRAFSFS
jgi:hypothetical protein